MIGDSARTVLERLFQALVVTALVAPSAVTAQLLTAPSPNKDFEFPSTWLNTTPPTKHGLSGKGVLLYFFEETCPRCKAQWPALLDVAEKHRNDPIAFVAVNSGTPAATLQAYARTVNLTWPILVDLDRSFEKTVGINEISLQNIVQVCYISSDGTLKPGRWSDLEDTISKALEGARWKIDPAEIPDELRAAWRSIEFGNDAMAAPAVQKALGSRKIEIKSAAQKLADVVATQAKADMDAAQAEAAQSKYRAYERYGAIAERYAGYPIVAEANAARRQLGGDPDLRKEIVAIKAIEKQRPLVASNKPAVRQRAIAAIQTIIEQNPASEAARIGREVLRQ
ncbi:MAG: TlpA disulfide reductase family protein [Pirellulales bacterium]